jgi:hypothetical protein
MISVRYASHRIARLGGLVLLCALGVGLAPVSAPALELKPALVISGVPNSNYPGGGGTIQGDPFPWLTVNITDAGSGVVKIEGEASIQTTWFFSQIHLNIAGIEGLFSGATWTFSDPVCTTCSFETKKAVLNSEVKSNSFKADGDGDFDVILRFDTSDGASTKFGGTDTFSIKLTCTGDSDCSSFDSTDFDSVSAPGGDDPKSGYRIAAHLQGLTNQATCAKAGGGTETPEGGCNSTWIAGRTNTDVPEPGIALFLGLGLLGASFVARRFTN